MDEAGDEFVLVATEAQQQPTPPPQDSQESGPAETHSLRSIKRNDSDQEAAAPDMPSPISADGEKHEERELAVLNSVDLGSPSPSYDFSNVRVRTTLTPLYIQIFILTICPVNPFAHIPSLPRWQQVLWYPAFRAPGL
jgi:hypothetical protein